MATMKETRYELLKVKWKEIIREQEKSGLAIRKWWCAVKSCIEDEGRPFDKDWSGKLVKRPYAATVKSRG